MSKRSTRALAAAACAAVAAGLVVSAGAAAHAAGNPPFEPDPNSYGTLTLYNSSGAVVTGGNLTDDPIAAYVVGNVAAPPGGSAASAYTKATLFLAAPQPGQNSTGWPNYQMSSSTTYPATSAPAPVGNAKDASGNNLPVVSGKASDGTLQAALSTFTPLASSSPDYDIYQLRVYQSGPGLSAGNSFEDVDITVNTTAGTWAEIQPTPTATTTTLSASPPSPQAAMTNGGTVSFSLNASSNAATPGTFEFFNGSTEIDSVAATVGSSTDTASFAVTQAAPTTDSYTAEFIPAPGNEYGSAYASSTSSALSYTATNPATPTTTVATAPTTASAYSPATFSATVSSGSGDPAGTVAFVATNTVTNATTSLGTGSESPAGSGDYAVTSSALGQGTYTLTATFTPTSTATYEPSSNTTSSFTVGAAQFPPDTQYIQAEVAPGTLTITTPYNSSSSPFDLGALSLSSNGSSLTASATFPNPSQGYITVTSSQAGDPSWTASVTASNLTSGNNSINAENLGLTNLQALQVAGNALTPSEIAFTPIPADNGVSPTDTSGGGLAGGPHQFASTAPNGGAGSININGTLTLNAPTSTPSGTYDGTITFTVV